jgi:hypothetical protein
MCHISVNLSLYLDHTGMMYWKWYVLPVIVELGSGWRDQLHAPATQTSPTPTYWLEVLKSWSWQGDKDKSHSLPAKYCGHPGNILLRVCDVCLKNLILRRLSFSNTHLLFLTIFCTLMTGVEFWECCEEISRVWSLFWSWFIWIICSHCIEQTPRLIS